MGIFDEHLIPAIPFFIKISSSRGCTMRDIPDSCCHYVDSTLVSMGKTAVEPLIAEIKRSSTQSDYSGYENDMGSLLIQIGEPAVMPLIATLKDENPQVRSYAISTVGQIAENTADNRVVDPIILALKDKDKGVRSEAFSVLLNSIYDLAVKPLISALSNESSDIRASAAEILGMRKEPSAVEPLIKVLNDRNPEVRRCATEALGKIGDPRSKEPLVNMMKDEDETVRIEAVKVVGDMKDIGLLITVIKNNVRADRNQSTVVMFASSALEEIGEPAVEPLLEALKDENPRVREEVVGILGRIKDDRIAESLLETYQNDKDEFVRCYTIYALGIAIERGNMIVDSRVIDTLILALQDESCFIRSGAADALQSGVIKDPRLIELIIIALRNDDSCVRNEGMAALKAITGKDFGEDKEKWLEWWEQNRGEIR